MSTQCFRGRPVLKLLQHRLVDAVLRRVVGGQSSDHRLHRDSPPRGRRHDAEVEGPRAFVLRQSVAEHVVVGMTVQPFRHLGVDLAPVGVGAGTAGVVVTGDPGGGDGYITSQNRSARASGSTDISACISVVPDRGSPVTNMGRSTTSSATGYRLRSSKNSRREVSSQWHTSSACRLPVGIHADAVEKVDGDCETLRQGGIAVVAQAGVGLRAREHRLGVQLGRSTTRLRTGPSTRLRRRARCRPTRRCTTARPFRRSRGSWAPAGLHPRTP